MKITQRSESMNSFLRSRVTEYNTLLEFVVRYENALKSQREKENNSDQYDRYYIQILFPQIIYSLLIEAFLPLKYIFFTLPLTLVISIILCRLICVLSWKKGFIMGFILFAIILIVSSIEGIVLGVLNVKDFFK